MPLPSKVEAGGGGCGRPLVSAACGVYGIQIAIQAIDDQRSSQWKRRMGMSQILASIIDHPTKDRINHEICKALRPGN